MRGQWLLWLAMGLGAVACGNEDSSAPETDTLSHGGAGPTIPDPENASAQDLDLDGHPYPPSGTLTAGDWDDNLNWTFFLGYRSAYLDAVPDAPAIAVDDRVVVRVTDDQGNPVANALVEIRSDNQAASPFFSAVTGSDGRLLFFPSRDGQSGEAADVHITPPGPAGALDSVTVEAPNGTEWNLVLPQAPELTPKGMDIAFVVDTTGSMADELTYLQQELESIAGHARDSHPSLDMRFALVVYRDDDQPWITRSFDFTPELTQVVADLAEQTATGGGGFTEAVLDAMHALRDLSWRDTGENVARVAFLLADAAPHDGEVDDALVVADSLRKQGIRLYTIAASGADDDAQYYLRQAAQLTLGRYLFLTGDSGIGSGNTDPRIPCYQVQYLDDLIGRMIASEATGRRVAADAAEVLRVVGAPDPDGVCTLADGTTVSF